MFVPNTPPQVTSRASDGRVPYPARPSSAAGVIFGPNSSYREQSPPPPPPVYRQATSPAAPQVSRNNYVAQSVPNSPVYMHHNAVPSPVPEMIGLYRIERILGQGTFGKVKLGVHVHTGERAAIKIIEQSNIKNDKQRTSVQREVRLMKLLKHPHIVDVREVIDDGQKHVIIMEHAQGGELFDYIVKRGRCSETDARRFFRQVVSAVGYCHANSVIHRDLKPENLLLDANGNIKVIDFGFGNTYHRGSLLSTYCGSPFYAAPEMIRGIRYVGPEVDIWSLGVILFALIAGRLPFDAENMADLYNKIGRGVYETPSHMSQEAAALISSMLTVDPMSRATLDAVAANPWVNKGYDTPVDYHIPPRQNTILQPNEDTMAQLIDFGFPAQDAYRALADDTITHHPIISLYHLLDEVRQRRESERSSTPIHDHYLYYNNPGNVNQSGSSIHGVSSGSGMHSGPQHYPAQKHHYYRQYDSYAPTASTQSQPSKRSTPRGFPNWAAFRRLMKQTPQK